MTKAYSRSSAQFTKRRAIDLNSQRTLFVSCVLVPVIFGLYSIWLGADSNWDLTNYHLYNPFAWLNRRLAMDLAPAGFQSYFNPLLDVPFYWMNEHFPPRLVGFLMGALHGMNFLLLLGIARSALPGLPDEDGRRVPLLLAVAGVLSASLLTGLGNSMGDDTTALFTLAGLLVLVSKWERLSEGVAGAGLVAASGMIVGLGVGLKLTTACYALAMCIALLSYPVRALVRIRLSFIFGVGVLVGLCISGGYWMFHMWQTFGNPLYPQFGKFFPNALAQPLASSDVRWLPHGAFENAMWPFVFSVNPRRLGEVPVRQMIWPIAYLLFWCWLSIAVLRRSAQRECGALDSRAKFLVLYVAIGYLIWMRIFSVYRYVVAIEVLLPTVVFVFATRLWGYRSGRRAAGWLIGLATAFALVGGVKSWGHEGWTDPLYHAEVPSIAQPARTTAIIYSMSSGWAWLATLFPHEVAFTQLDGSFPATAAFNDRIRQLVNSRGGEGFAIIDGAYNWRVDSIATGNRLLGKTGLTGSARGCAFLGWVTTKLHLHARLEMIDGDPAQCRLGVRADDFIDVAAKERALAEQAVPAFDRLGLPIDPRSCRPYRAWIGTGVYAYQWCRVRAR